MKKAILYISPGPTFKPHDLMYQEQFKELSKIFKGYIFTTSSTEETIKIDDFMYSSMKTDHSVKSVFRFAVFCIQNAVELKRNKQKIDLVSTYDPLKTGLIGLIVSRILKAKFAPEVNGVYTSPSEWLDEPNSITTKLKKILYPFIIHFVLKRSDGIRLLFKNQIDPFEKIVKGKIVKNFPCYVATDSFKNIGEEKVVLFVGFPFKRKGVDILIKAFKKIAPKYPEWKLNILGWFPDMTVLSAAIGDHPQIYHHKPVHYIEMAKYIGSCAILVLPSRSEAMGRVLVEAMAAGKPRIGANVDGIPSVINDGVDGLLVDPGNIDDLANKLDMLMSDPDMRHKLGKNGELRVGKEFTKELYNQHIVSFYNEVIGS